MAAPSHCCAIMKSSDRERQNGVDRILPKIRRLLRSLPFWTGETEACLIRGAEYYRGRWRIDYLSEAAIVDGRLRSTGPISLDVAFDGYKVLAIRWDAKRVRLIRAFVPGTWIDDLDAVNRSTSRMVSSTPRGAAASRPRAQVPR